jgi:hypothetical protein
MNDGAGQGISAANKAAGWNKNGLAGSKVGIQILIKKISGA